MSEENTGPKFTPITARMAAKLPDDVVGKYAAFRIIRKNPGKDSPLALAIEHDGDFLWIDEDCDFLLIDGID